MICFVRAIIREDPKWFGSRAPFLRQAGRQLALSYIHTYTMIINPSCVPPATVFDVLTKMTWINLFWFLNLVFHPTISCFFILARNVFLDGSDFINFHSFPNINFFVKARIFWEGHKNLAHFPLFFLTLRNSAK